VSMAAAAVSSRVGRVSGFAVGGSFTEVTVIVTVAGREGRARVRPRRRRLTPWKFGPGA